MTHPLSKPIRQGTPPANLDWLYRFGTWDDTDYRTQESEPIKVTQVGEEDSFEEEPVPADVTVYFVVRGDESWGDVNEDCLFETFEEEGIEPPLQRDEIQCFDTRIWFAAH